MKNFQATSFLSVALLCVFLSSCKTDSGLGTASVMESEIIQILNDGISTNVKARDASTDIGVSEGDADNLIYFRLQLGMSFPHDITVNYRTENGTALAGEDYLSSTGKALIPSGQQNALIAIKVIGDLTLEDNEYFSLIISEPVGISFPSGVTELTATHFIVNDDYLGKLPPIVSDPEFPKKLTSLVLASMPPLMDAPRLLEQPSLFSDAFLFGANSAADKNCPISGKFGYTFTDINNPNDRKYSSSGDKFEFTTVQCKDANRTVNGNYSLLIDRASESSTSSELDTNVDFDQLNVSQNNRTFMLDGQMSLAVSEPLNGIGSGSTKFNTDRFDLVSTEIYRFSELRGEVQSDLIFDQKNFSELDAKLTLINSIADGDYTFSILEPFRLTPFSQFPDQGKLRIDLVNPRMTIRNMRVFVTVQSSETVRLETDWETDGVIDSIQDVSWVTLNTGF